MTFTASIPYTQLTPRLLDPPVIITGSPDEPITAILTPSISINMTTPVIGSPVSAAATFINNVWKATGTKAEVNSLLSNIYILPGSGFSNFTIDILVKDVNDSTIESGSYTLTGSRLFPLPTISVDRSVVNQATTSTGVQEDFIVTVGNLTAAATGVVTIRDENNNLITNGSAGSLRVGRFGRGLSNFSAGVLSFHGLAEEVNEFFGNIQFIPPNPASIGNYKLQYEIFTNGGSANANTVFADELNWNPKSITIQVKESLTYNLPNIDLIGGSGTFTIIMQLSDIDAGSISTGTFGTVTSTFDPSTGIWQASGTNKTHVEAAQNAAQLTVSSGYTDNFTIELEVSDSTTTFHTDFWTIEETSIAPESTNLTNTVDYYANFVNELPTIVITDPDTHNTFTARITLNDNTKGSFTTGTYGSTTSTYNSSTGIWEAIGTLTDVNAALADIKFDAELDIVDGFTATTEVDDGIFPITSGTWTFNNIDVAPLATNINTDSPLTYIPLPGIPTLPIIVITDPNTNNTFTARLTLSSIGLAELTTGTYGSTTSTYNSSTGIWEAIGTLTDVNAALADVSIEIESTTDSSFSISTFISDGIPSYDLNGTWNFEPDAWWAWDSGNDGTSTSIGSIKEKIIRVNSNNFMTYQNNDYSIYYLDSDNSFIHVYTGNVDDLQISGNPNVANAECSYISDSKILFTGGTSGSPNVSRAKVMNTTSISGGSGTPTFGTLFEKTNSTDTSLQFSNNLSTSFLSNATHLIGTDWIRLDNLTIGDANWYKINISGYNITTIQFLADYNPSNPSKWHGTELRTGSTIQKAGTFLDGTTINQISAFNSRDIPFQPSALSNPSSWAILLTGTGASNYSALSLVDTGSGNYLGRISTVNQQLVSYSVSRSSGGTLGGLVPINATMCMILENVSGNTRGRILAWDDNTYVINNNDYEIISGGTSLPEQQHLKLGNTLLVLTGNKITPVWNGE